MHLFRLFVMPFLIISVQCFAAPNRNVALKTFESYDFISRASVIENTVVKTKGFMKLIRHQSIFPTLILNLAGGWLANPSLQYLVKSKQFIVGSAITILIMSLSMITNDIFDIDVDKINNPGRPLITGEITKKEAIIATGIMTVIIEILNFRYMSSNVKIHTHLALLMVLIYTPILKKIIFLKNLSCSGLVSFALYYTGNIVSGESTTPNVLLDIATQLIFWGSLQNEILLDIADSEGDKKNGILTIPVVFGKDAAFTISNYIAHINILWRMYYLISREYTYSAGFLMMLFCSPILVGLRRIKNMNYKDITLRNAVKETTKPMILALSYLCFLRSATK